jgi:hypothetical protein
MRVRNSCPQIFRDFIWAYRPFTQCEWIVCQSWNLPDAVRETQNIGGVPALSSAGHLSDGTQVLVA